MKKHIVLFLLFAWVSAGVSGKSSGSYSVPKYEIVCNGVGVEGIYVAKVSVYLPKPDKEAEDNLRMAAVHGVLFKGLGASKSCTGQRPLCEDTDCEQKHKEFFDAFFGSDATYNRYVSIVEGSLRVTKIGKKQYCVSAVVSVNKDSLRKFLEQKHVIQGFDGLF